MKKLYILLLMAAIPGYVTAAIYTNKTGHPLLISTNVGCDDVLDDEPQFEPVTFSKSLTQGVMIHEECLNGQCLQKFVEKPCMEVITIELAKDESGELINEASQPVTIVSPKLNEERIIFPTNDSFNYQIGVENGPSSYAKLKINQPQ